MEYDIPLCNTSKLFSYYYETYLFIPVNFEKKLTVMEMTVLDWIQLVPLMPNMNKQISIMLLLIPTPSLTRSVVWPVQCFIQTENCFMAPLESTLTNRFTLNSSLGLSWYITMITLSHMYTTKPSRRTWLHIWPWHSQTKQGLWLGVPCLHCSKKDGQVWQIADLCWFNKAIACKEHSLPIIADLLEQISRYKFFTKRIFLCNTLPLSSTSLVKNSLFLWHHLADMNTNASLWASNMFQTLHNKSWDRWHALSKTLTYTLITLVSSPLIGNIT